jgi:MFS family permease
MAFGAITLGMAFCTSWEQLVVCRALLGIFEAGFFPVRQELFLNFLSVFNDFISF